MKKVLSIVLALALVLAIAAPAFASAPAPITDSAKLATGGTVKVDGETSVGIVKVTLPGASKMIVNPYGLTVITKAETSPGAGDAETSNKQVIYPTQYIASNSTAALDVTATVTGVVAGNAKLVAEPFDPIATHTAGEKVPNNLFLVMQTKDVTAGATPSEPSWTDPAKTDTITAGDYVADGNGYIHSTIVSSRGAATKVGKLAASADTGDDAETTYVAFRMAGLVEKNPTTPWTDKDKVTATIAFTFAPVKSTS